MFDWFYLFMSSHPHILVSLCSCVLACILTSLHPHAHVWLLVSLHPHILISSGFFVLAVCSHPRVNVFSIWINNCIVASLSSLVVILHLDHFVDNLQILQTGQAFVFVFYRTGRKIYRKQPLIADLKKGFVNIWRNFLKNTCEGINFLEKLHPRSLQIYWE